MRPGFAIILWAAFATTLSGTPPGIDQDLECVRNEDGVPFVQWYGIAGRSYFIQASDSGDLLENWYFLPVIEGGGNEPISHELEEPLPDTAFFRLKYIDRVPGPGEDLDTADFDDDGLSNQDEVETGLYHTDPLDPDTDGDGMPDGWEVESQLAPTAATDATGDPDQDGLTNLEEYRNASDPRDGDSDGDGLANSYEVAQDTDPYDADTDHDGIPDNEDDSPTTAGHAAIYSAQAVSVWSPRQ
jgi:hypothetical protein